eukprot:1158645-Pelagomonas_calceolata.AAC.8
MQHYLKRVLNPNPSIVKASQDNTSRAGKIQSIKRVDCIPPCLPYPPCCQQSPGFGKFTSTQQPKHNEQLQMMHRRLGMPLSQFLKEVSHNKLGNMCPTPPSPLPPQT